MDISQYVIGHKERFKLEDQKREEFYCGAISKAKQIAEELSRVFSGTEVAPFGSLTSDFYELTSDIYLAIKGLQEEDYFKALKIAEDIAAPSAKGVICGKTVLSIVKLT